MCISRPCRTPTHGQKLPNWGREGEEVIGAIHLGTPISFQIILTLAGHWSGGTQVLIVNHCQKDVGIDRFLSNIVSRNIVALEKTRKHW